MFMVVIATIFRLTSSQVAASESPELSSVCRVEGRFPAPGECEGYVECVAQHEGSLRLTAHYHRCPSGFFHPALARCVAQAQEDACPFQGGEEPRLGRGKDRRGAPSRSGRHDVLCAGKLGFACASCMEVVVCAGREAYLSHCDTDTRCVEHDRFSGGVCYPRWPQQNCSCTAAGQVMPDMYDHMMFLQCAAPQGAPDVFHCDDLHVFDPETLTCMAAPPLPPCSATGVFPVEAACRWYYSCMPGGAGEWRQSYQLCPSEKVYSQALAECVDPQSLAAGTLCSTKRKMTSYSCSFWQLLLVFFFPKHIASICYTV